MLLHDPRRYWLAKDLHFSAKATADVQFPRPQHGCFDAVRPNDGAG
jgi:hypothetical protein